MNLTGMTILYLLALIPALIGIIVWRFNTKTIRWYEWLGCTGLGLLLCVVFNFLAVAGMTADTETWSGRVSRIEYHPYWQSWYNEAIYKNVTKWRRVKKTFGTGEKAYSKWVDEQYTDRVFSHYERRLKDHKEYATAWSTLGQQWNISKAQFDAFAAGMGGVPEPVRREVPQITQGSEYKYVCSATAGIIPVTMLKSFENKAKGSPSSFSFKKVESGDVFKYPVNDDVFSSSRVMGDAKQAISTLEWDRLNSRLGPTKKVNLIIIGFGNREASIAELQRNAWLNGKKNDLVICYGGDSNPKSAQWACVFGWTESETVKKNIEAIIVGADQISDAIIPHIEQAVVKDYQIKDWHKFDKINVDLTPGLYVLFLAILGVVQVGAYWFVKTNG